MERLRDIFFEPKEFAKQVSIPKFFNIEYWFNYNPNVLATFLQKAERNLKGFRDYFTELQCGNKRDISRRI